VAAQYGIDYRESSPDRAVAATPEAVAAVDRFFEPMPEDGVADLSVITQLDEIGTPASVTMTGPRYFGFVTGATIANFSALAAARNRVYRDIGWNIEADGLIDATKQTAPRLCVHKRAI